MMTEYKTKAGSTNRKPESESTQIKKDKRAKD